METDGAGVADGLVLLLQRGVRARLYDRMVQDVHPAVTTVSYPIISGVARYGPITATELGHELGLDRSFISRHGAALTRAGLLTATQDSNDARATRLNLTPAGGEVIATLRQHLHDVIDELLASWSPTERHQLAGLLPRFARTLTETPPNLTG